MLLDSSVIFPSVSSRLFFLRELDIPSDAQEISVRNPEIGFANFANTPDLTSVPSEMDEQRGEDCSELPISGAFAAMLPVGFGSGADDFFRYETQNFINSDFEYDDEDAFRYDDFDDDFDEDFEELPDDEFEDFPDPYSEDEEDGSEEEVIPDDLEEVDPFDDFDDLDSDENTFEDDDPEEI